MNVNGIGIFSSYCLLHDLSFALLQQDESDASTQKLWW